MKKLIFLLIILLSFYPVKAQDEIPINRVDIDGFTEDDFITAPAVSFDGNYLMFVVVKPDSYKMYECRLSQGKLSKPRELTNITKFLGKNTYKNSPIYNHDASKIYFSANVKGNKDIYVSMRTGTTWTQPKVLPTNINTTANEIEPSISANDNILYFVRLEDSKNDECGKLYVAVKNVKNKWQKAKAVIEPINLSCERTPRLLSDNKTVLFASKREKDKNFRLYYAKNPYYNTWFVPKNIGNLSKHDVMYPTTDYKGKKLYFTVSRKDKNSQIYSADMPTKCRPGEMKFLKGKIVDLKGKPVPATINLMNPYSLTSTSLYHNAEDGNYSLLIQPKSNYLIDISGKKLSHKFVSYNNSKLNETNDTLNAELFNKVNLLLKIYDRDIYEPIDAKIKVTDKQNNSEIACKQTKLSEGRYKLTIPIGSIYSIEITNEFTKPFTLDFDLSGSVEYQNYVKNVEIESEKVAYTFNVTDNDTKSGIQCQITLTNLNSNQKVTTTATTNSKGNITVFARKGDYYDVSINPKGYTFYNTKLNVKNNAPQQINITLQALKQNMKIELNNITFETNSADLNLASYEELNKVVELLNNNPEIKVEISAHTDDIGSNTYNLLLSKRRAKSVVDYLISRKVNINSLVYEGYGEKQPLVPNNSKQNRAKNRRVELKIIEII